MYLFQVIDETNVFNIPKFLKRQANWTNMMLLVLRKRVQKKKHGLWQQAIKCIL